MTGDSIKSRDASRSLLPLPDGIAGIDVLEPGTQWTAAPITCMMNK